MYGKVGAIFFGVHTRVFIIRCIRDSTLIRHDIEVVSRRYLVDLISSNRITGFKNLSRFRISSICMERLAEMVNSRYQLKNSYVKNASVYPFTRDTIEREKNMRNKMPIYKRRRYNNERFKKKKKEMVN